MLDDRPSILAIREMAQHGLTDFLSTHLHDLQEDEALAVLSNRNCNSALCDQISRSARLTAQAGIRSKLVEHRATPQSQALKLIHYLFWSDLVRISTDMQVSPVVRRAIDSRLLAMVTRLTLGEKIAAAKRCSRELIRVFLFDEHPRVFEALLINSRLSEEDLLRLIGSEEARAHQLMMIASDRKWSGRYEVRRALVLNPRTPKSIAASQLRFLKRDDLVMLLRRPSTSVYLQRCIERMQPTGGR